MNELSHLPSGSPTSTHSTGGVATGTILYVDNDPEIRRLHRQALERLGYTVRTANDGEEGWDWIHRQHFDLVVTIHEVPRMDGLKFARQIRDNGLSHSMIIASGNSLHDVDLNNLHLSAILQKPFTLIDLLVAVRRTLRVNPVEQGNNRASVLAGDHLEHAAALSGHWGINE